MKLRRNDVKEFIARLPELDMDQVHFLCLLCRSRLMKEKVGFKLRVGVVAREIVKPTLKWRDRYFRKVVRLEALRTHGEYTWHKLINGEERTGIIPADAFGIYGLVAPRDMYGALESFMNTAIKAVFHHHETVANMHNRFVSLIHASRGSRRYLTVDVDDASLKEEVQQILAEYPLLMSTRTNRGYHYVLDFSQRQSMAQFYKEAKPALDELDEVEIKNDPLEPIPGTWYGVRHVSFIE